MELKNYQKSVLSDIEQYIDFLSADNDCSKAYDKLWDHNGYRTGIGGVKSYNNTFPGVPDVCLKVPTGGGKTFIACAALKKIYDGMPRNNKVVLWMVPSSAILEQTIKNLKNPSHPYRQRLNADFSGQVGVYDIEELLSGQNFNPQIIQEQLSICVLSYSSTRTSNVDNRRMYRQNGALQPFITLTRGQNLELGDPPSLMGVFNKLSPIIVLDESHNAGSTLTKKALESMNPSFILELTATPKKDSNIISIVTARTLKKENMVKIPLLVYGRPDVEHVISTTIDHRRVLEEVAKKEYGATGRYVRPIALIQAQPKNDEDSVTFERIKKLLIASGIPENHIAIKVSNKDELKGIDLTSDKCEIRYIITVNALKEGWDCPFAYILSSIARRSSETEVEQIIGRILRQPGASKFNDNILNMSYTITSSKVFHETLDEVSKGLQAVGFTKKDYRIAEGGNLDYYTTGDENTPGEENVPTSIETQDSEIENPTETEIDNFDVDKIKNLLKKNNGDGGLCSEGGYGTCIDPDDARNKGREFENSQNDTNVDEGDIFMEYNRKVKIKEEFKEDAKSIKFPKFMYRDYSPLFGNEFLQLLSEESLTKEFELSKMNREINLNLDDIDAGKWELSEGNDTELKYSQLTKAEIIEQRNRFKDVSSKDDKEVKEFVKEIVEFLNRIDYIETGEIKRYVELIVGDMQLDELNNARKNVKEISYKIKDKIESLAREYREKRFDDLCTLSVIVTDLSDGSNGYYTLPDKIDPHDTNKRSISYAKSLYERCQGVEGLEERILHIIDRSDNVLWWHRIVASGKDEFSLNGPIGHYPDFIARTKTGVTVLIEAKGSQLNNPDTKLKIKIGKEWEKLAGSKFRYYMVFENESQKAEGSISSEKMEEYLNMLRP